MKKREFWGANPMYDEYELLVTVERMRMESRRKYTGNFDRARELEQKNDKPNDKPNDHG